MSVTVNDEVLAFAHRLADVAKTETLKYFRGDALEMTSKEVDGFDPVTAADRAAEEVMRALIETERPQDGILGEEYGIKDSENGLTWVLDPIDGTRAYISGAPTWGTLIALHDGTAPVLGIIDQPYIGERFFGMAGLARYTGPLGERNMRVATTKRLEDAIIFTTFPEVGDPTERDAFHDVAGRCRLTRYGMDCYAYGLLAAGQIDLVIEAGLAPYDIQAPIAVIEAAGGMLTDWSGKPVDQGGRSLAAATPELHAAAMEILKAHV